jgi:hypothetical protein
MTLNITVLSTSAIFQSADFRLSHEGRALSDPSTKRLVVDFSDWSGFITYAGVGRSGSEHTTAVLRRWMRGIGDIAFDDLAELIRRSGSVWLRRIGPQRHTFVLAGYDKGLPKAAIISNFELWHGAETGVLSADLHTSVVATRNQPEVVVTGVRSAVLRQERRGLQRLVAEHGHEHTRVRSQIMAINRAAAARKPELISPECVVYSQGADGVGAEVPSGSIPVQDMGLFHGEDMAEKLRPFLEQTFGKGGWRLVQSASGRSGPRQIPPPCSIEIATEESAQNRLRVLEEAEGRRAMPRAADSAIIVGEATPTYGGPSFPCLWPEPGALQLLGHFGGLGGQAVGIASDGTIVGQSELPDRSMHAMIWAAGEIIDIHPAGNRSSGVRAVSPSGIVAGWVANHPTEHGQDVFRPAIWKSHKEPIILADLRGGWGEAVFVNDQLVAAGFVYHGNNCSGWISNGDQVTYIGLPPPPCRSFIPYTMTADGQVLGVQINANESRHVATWDRGKWSTEELPPGAIAEAFDEDGSSAGKATVNDLQLPWLRRQQTMLRLPYLRHHNHSVTVIRGHRILGAAMTQTCSHPLEWTLAGQT